MLKKKKSIKNYKNKTNTNKKPKSNIKLRWQDTLLFWGEFAWKSRKKQKDRGEENPSSLLCFKSIELNFI